MPNIMFLPKSLQSPVKVQWQSFIDLDIDVSLLPVEVITSLAKVWACSDFVKQTCVRFPELFLELVSSGDLLNTYSDEHYKNSIIIDFKKQDEAALSKHLRIFRRREMLRIVWRDIAGWSELKETTHDLSAMAEACIDFSLSSLYQWQCKELGTPVNEEGVAQELVVLGMGKLGAWELNVSSDIDLIFAFSEEGEVKGGSKPLANSEFFSRLGKKLIQSLDQQTEDGFVFRVDMRLRPFGQTGPLVSSFSSFENYYLVHGRSWERYAMVKVRVVAGDKEKGDELLSTLKPFVYRRYLDYGAYESLRELKEMIKQEVQRKGMNNNVKLGAGGIREVEFTAQVFQLIRGGRDTDLQERRVLVVLDHLASKKLLPDYVVNELKDAYVFLRNTEHRIQEYQDKQTHNLPDNAIGQARLGLGMGFDSWDLFLTVLNKHRENVAAHFEQVFVAPQIENHEIASGKNNSGELDETQRLIALWYNKLDEQDALALLSEKGFDNSAAALKQLQTLHQSRQYASLSRQGQTRLDRLMPLLLGALQQVDNVDDTFERVFSLLTNVARRSVYLALLLENPMVLSQLIKLCSASPWIARYLKQLPILLDELMDPRSLYQPPDKSSLEVEIRSRLAQLDLDDVEQGMDALRHFKQANVLRVAAADIVDAIPLMKVSDHLSWIAEVILDEALEQAWRHLVARHGRPVCKLEGELCDKGFAVIGYGKLGGYELGYSSDLDMVFLHGSESNNLETVVNKSKSDEAKGEKSIAVPVFFARLGQRIIHLLTTLTPAGVLYEVDMRLRPDGASGLLVTNLKAYRDYQLKKAWLWEHQALVRARVVAGDPKIAEQFNNIRREVLSQQRNRDDLRKEVLDMRNRMRKELSKEKSGQFDLKQGVGGIVDIEFMVQYGVLAWAFEKPDLLEYTDNIHLLEAFALSGLMEKADAEVLSNAYQTFRAKLHKMALQEQPGLVDIEEYKELSTAVQQIWLHWLENE